MIPPRCSFCEHENPVGAKYCNECGTLLDLLFCNCGAVNGVTDAACYRCGASLALPQAAARVVGLEAELREVEEQLRGYERQLKKPEQHASRSERQSMEDQRPPAAAVGQARRGLEHEFRGFEHGSRAPEQAPQGFEKESPVPRPGESAAGGAALPVSEPTDAPRRRRHRYAAAAFVVVIVFAVAAGWYFYHRYGPSLSLTAGAVRGSADVARVPGSDAAGEPAIAAGSARATETTGRSSADAPTGSQAGTGVAGTAASFPGSPIASASQATHLPMASRADVGETPAPAEAPEPRCPPAVMAMALCEWAADANRR